MYVFNFLVNLIPTNNIPGCPIYGLSNSFVAIIEALFLEGCRVKQRRYRGLREAQTCASVLRSLKLANQMKKSVSAA